MSRYDVGSVLIGFARGDSVTIRVIRREYSQLDDDWEPDWLATPIAVRAGGFRADVDAALRTAELRGFRIGLQDLYVSLRGEARLESAENWIDLRITSEGRGRIAVRGEIVDSLGVGNRLRFAIGGLDQTFLPPMIRALEQIEAAFPVVSFAGR